MSTGSLFGRGKHERRGRHHCRAGRLKSINFTNFVPRFPDVPTERSNLNLRQINESNYSLRKELGETSFHSVPNVIKDVKKLVAVIDELRCTGCGACEEVCPRSAIIVDTFASINGDLCIGCGICSSVCPMDAITIS